MRVNFEPMVATQKVSFTCSNCGKAKRARTFRVECTVNPFNKGADGLPLTRDEVRQQSKDKVAQEVAEFKREPWCASCEGGLGWKERTDLRDRRRAARNEGAQ